MTSWSHDGQWTAWMQAAMAGDAAAYRLFLAAVTPYLRTIVRSRCRSWSALDGEIEDIVQEVLLAVHLKRGTWDQSRPVGPWIAAIARNKLIDALRRRGRQISVPIEDVVETLRAEEQDDRPMTHEVNNLLAKLKENQREIVRSISIDGASVRDTADRLKMSEGAVRVALHRALQTLASLYRSQVS